MILNLGSLNAAQLFLMNIFYTIKFFFKKSLICVSVIKWCFKFVKLLWVKWSSPQSLHMRMHLTFTLYLPADRHHGAGASCSGRTDPVTPRFVCAACFLRSSQRSHGSISINSTKAEQFISVWRSSTEMSVPTTSCLDHWQLKNQQRIQRN